MLLLGYSQPFAAIINSLTVHNLICFRKESPMGDKKSKKDKAKVNRQKNAKQAKAEKQKQDKRQPLIP